MFCGLCMFHLWVFQLNADLCFAYQSFYIFKFVDWFIRLHVCDHHWEWRPWSRPRAGGVEGSLPWHGVERPNMYQICITLITEFRIQILQLKQRIHPNFFLNTSQTLGQICIRYVSHSNIIHILKKNSPPEKFCFQKTKSNMYQICIAMKTEFHIQALVVEYKDPHGGDKYVSER